MHCNWRISQGVPARQAAAALQPLPLHGRPLSSSGSSSSSSSSRRTAATWRRSRAISSSSSSRSVKTASHLCPRPVLQLPPRTACTPASPAAAATTAARHIAAAAAAAAAGTADAAARLAAPVVVIGGGPAGLASALMLARRGYSNVKFFERLSEPPAPGDLSVWGNFEQARERLYMIGHLPPLSSMLPFRGGLLGQVRLASCLLQELRERYLDAVSVTFGARCVQADWRQSGSGGQEVCRLTFQQQSGSSSSSSSTGSTTSTISVTASSSSSSSSSSSEAVTEWVEESSFVIGADGAGSSLRAAMETSSSTPFSVKRFPDKNTIVYRTIPLFWPKELATSRPGDVNYSARTKSGINLDCLPTKEGPFIGVMLYKPGDKRIAALKTDEDVRALFQEHFPAFLPAVREVDLQRFADKPDCSLPTFSYAGPVLHYGHSTVLVGDAIHTVKPYFGQGVNSAFEDVAVLEKALDETDDDAGAAVRRYSQLRAKDAEALVVLSHSLDGGFTTFVGPLILDSMLHKLAPKIFSPNIIASLQNEAWSFAQIRARKRWDRALQVGLLAAVGVVLLRMAAALLGLASKLLGRVGAV
uniref:FAD-binding domain-containing protein n=1 Tax=Tetradesmus obliquus TaxID=3088 RepID=A0A383WGF8_TETOB